MTLFTVLQKQANQVGWTLTKQHNGYRLGSNPHGGGFLCENLVSVADQISSQFDNIIKDKNWAINKLVDEMKELNRQLDEYTYDDEDVNNKYTI